MFVTTRKISQNRVAALVGLPVMAAGLFGTQVLLPTRAAHPTAGYHKLMKAVAHTDKASSAKLSFTEKVVASGSAGISLNLSGSGEVSGLVSDRAADVTFTVGGLGTMEMRLVMPNLYLHLPSSLQSRLQTNKPWIAINLNQLAQAKFGTSLSQLTSGSNQVSETLAELRAASDSVTEVGPATIKGVATTEYKATIDLDKAAGSKLTTSAIKQLESLLGSNTLPVEVWIDHNNLLRQVSYDLTVHAPTSTSGSSGSVSSVSISATVDLYDYGVAVLVTPPPASEVQDVTAQMLSSSSSTT